MQQLRYVANAGNFAKIPGSPIAYWVSLSLYRCFEGKKIKDYAQVRSGMSTTDNDRFLRVWYEVGFYNSKFDCTSLDNAKLSGKKWFPYNKGGDYRRWYGNNVYLVNWKDDGKEIKFWVTHNPRDPNTTSWARRIFATDFFFKPGSTWSSVTTGNFSCRNYENGFIFDSGANGLFADNLRYQLYLTGFLNTKIANKILKIINPTINNGPGSVEKIPAVVDDRHLSTIDELVLSNITSCKDDWDSFETSWDFKKHPLI